MRAYDIILKKRNGLKLTDGEIKFLIDGYVAGRIPDYQVAAWAMAVYFTGFDREETAALTMAMVNSGDKIDLSSIPGIKVDKHSTGGVGDKTTLVLVPLVAAAGIKVAKMSGRGLGHTGGTLDKLESIPGFKVDLDLKKFSEVVNKVGCAVAGQTGNLVPADKKLYALRDVTATVDIVPLIASSVMCKKIAAGADKIVLDVKAGDGAFMKSVDEAFGLARQMVEIGREVGKETVALITSMEQPLGYNIGNSLEVKEAVSALKGKGPDDLEELCLELGARMLTLAGRVETTEEGKNLLKEQIRSGTAYKKFKEMVAAQKGDVSAIDDTQKLPHAPVRMPVMTEEEGFVHSIGAESLGLVAMSLGAGREKKDDKIDHSVGIELKKKVADRVNKGEVLAVVHALDNKSAKKAVMAVKRAYTIISQTVEKPKLLLGEITPSDL